jgi:hypothetical protein
MGLKDKYHRPHEPEISDESKGLCRDKGLRHSEAAESAAAQYAKE